MASTITYVNAVNRLLRIAAIIRGDDDDITLFTESQHAADISLAQIALQDELDEVAADNALPYEITTTTFTSVSGQVAYSLASDFHRFWEQVPFLYISADNEQVFEYPGGEQALRHEIFDYRTQQGDPYWWYFLDEDKTGATIGLFPVPDASSAGTIYSYQYEKQLSLSSESDLLPFYNDAQARAYISMATQRFKYMRDKVELGSLPLDPTYSNARTRLLGHLKQKDSRMMYGNHYG